MEVVVHYSNGVGGQDADSWFAVARLENRDFVYRLLLTRSLFVSQTQTLNISTM